MRAQSDEISYVFLCSTEFTWAWIRHTHLKNGGFETDSELAQAKAALEISLAVYRVALGLVKR